MGSELPEQLLRIVVVDSMVKNATQIFRAAA